MPLAPRGRSSHARPGGEFGLRAKEKGQVEGVELGTPPAPKSEAFKGWIMLDTLWTSLDRKSAETNLEIFTVYYIKRVRFW